MIGDAHHPRTPFYATCLAVQVGDSHRRGAPSHWGDSSGRWFVDAKRVDPGTVTPLSLLC